MMTQIQMNIELIVGFVVALVLLIACLAYGAYDICQDEVTAIEPEAHRSEQHSSAGE
jgi:hypothetical protein